MQIDEIYAELAASLPTDGEEQDHAVIMTRESVPRPPDEIEADGIVVLHGRLSTAAEN